MLIVIKGNEKMTLEVYNLDEISKYQLKKQQQFHTLNEL